MKKIFVVVFLITLYSCTEKIKKEEFTYDLKSIDPKQRKEMEDLAKATIEITNRTDLDWKIQLLDADQISDRLYFVESAGNIRVVNSRGFSHDKSVSQGFIESISIENRIENQIGRISFRFFHYDDHGDIRSSGKFEVLPASKNSNLTFDLNKPLLDSYEVGEISLNKVSSFPRIGKGETLILLVDSVYFHEASQHETTQLQFNQLQLPTLDEMIEKRNERK